MRGRLHLSKLAAWNVANIGPVIRALRLLFGIDNRGGDNSLPGKGKVAFQLVTINDNWLAFKIPFIHMQLKNSVRIYDNEPTSGYFNPIGVLYALAFEELNEELTKKNKVVTSK